MPLGHTDEKLTGKSSRLTRRWLRELVLEDWTTKLVALAITLGLWFAVTSRQTPSTVRLRDVPIDFLLPENLEISNDPRDRVEVTVRGTKSELEQLNARDLVMTVDLRNYRAGERAVYLNARDRENIQMNLPPGVGIERVEPGSVPLVLENRIERDVPVEVRFEGNPRKGYEIRRAQATPAMIRVRGAESLVRKLERVRTDAISVDDRAESFSVNQQPVEIADEKIVALDPLVNVLIEIGETRVEKRFTNVRVRVAGEQPTDNAGNRDGGDAIPSTATIIVRAAPSALERLTADDFELQLENIDGALVPRLVVRIAELQPNVELVTTDPSKFTLGK